MNGLRDWNERELKHFEENRLNGLYSLCVYSTPHEDQARALAEGLRDLTFVFDHGTDVRLEPVKPSEWGAPEGTTHMWRVYIHQAIESYPSTLDMFWTMLHDIELGMRIGLRLAEARAQSAANVATTKAPRKKCCPRCNRPATKRYINGKQDGWCCSLCGEVFGSKVDKALAKLEKVNFYY